MRVKWSTCSKGRCFFSINGDIVALIRQRFGSWYAFDLTEEVYTHEGTYCPKFIGAYPSEEAAVDIVQKRFKGYKASSNTISYSLALL